MDRETVNAVVSEAARFGDTLSLDEADRLFADSLANDIVINVVGRANVAFALGLLKDRRAVVESAIAIALKMAMETRQKSKGGE